jgi:hypothetical protein
MQVRLRRGSKLLRSGSNVAARRSRFKVQKACGLQGSIRDIRFIRISYSYFKIVNPIACDQFPA